MMESNSEKIYNYLLEMILNCEITPGDKIAEEAIAARFNISRTPVREALRKLEADGLIKIYPRRFAQMITIDEKTMQDIGTLRISLEEMAIRLAILKGSRQQYSALMNIANECLQAAQNGNDKLRYKLDTEFHRYLAEISGNQEILKIIDNINLKIQYILLNNPKQLNKDTSNLQQHIQLVEALIAGDTQKAIQICFEHLASFYDLSDFLK